MARLLAAATALPRRRYTQREVAETCANLMGTAAARKAERLFANAGVSTRYLVEDPAYYVRNPSFESKNRDYFRHAAELARRAIETCLEEAGSSPGEVHHLLSVTTTGLLTPSLEAHLAQSLPFPRTLKRTPLFGVGCAGGAVGLARAYEYLRGAPEERVLLLSVELCSLTFLPQERSMTQLVAAALFGDGAAAVLLAGTGTGNGTPSPEILGAKSVLLPDSLEVMGWDFTDRGMRLVLDPKAPEVIERHVAGAVDGFLKDHGMTRGDVSRYLIHPGSSKILDACERALGLSPEQTTPSREFLAAHGNLSSASLLFILKKALADESTGGTALLVAFGPGFACELVLIRFP